MRARYLLYPSALYYSISISDPIARSFIIRVYNCAGKKRRISMEMQSVVVRNQSLDHLIKIIFHLPEFSYISLHNFLDLSDLFILTLLNCTKKNASARSDSSSRRPRQLSTAATSILPFIYQTKVRSFYC